MDDNLLHKYEMTGSYDGNTKPHQQNLFSGNSTMNHYGHASQKYVNDLANTDPSHNQVVNHLSSSYINIHQEFTSYDKNITYKKQIQDYKTNNAEEVLSDCVDNLKPNPNLIGQITSGAPE